MKETGNEYTKEKHSIDIFEANRQGMRLMLAIALVAFLLFYFLWPDSFLTKLVNMFAVGSFWEFVLGFFRVIAIVILGIIAHEFLHGIFWALFAKRGFRSVRFGILKKYMTPYCHSKEPLKVWQYIVGAFMPALFLGFIPLILSLIYGAMDWLIFGIFFTAAAIGDFIMIRMLLKETMNDWVQDHPSEPGYFMFRKRE